MNATNTITLTTKDHEALELVAGGDVIAWLRGEKDYRTINGNTENRLHRASLIEEVKVGTRTRRVAGVTMSYDVKVWALTQAGREALAPTAPAAAEPVVETAPAEAPKAPKLTTARRRALALIAAGGITVRESHIGAPLRIANTKGDRVRRDVFNALLRDRLITVDTATSLYAGQSVTLTPTRTALGVVPSSVKTANTRAHQVRAIGRQHADDAAGMGVCTVCGEVGEWTALVDLAPNAYGCSARSRY
ncbi:hypothetical protein ACFQ3Z_16385 [Streptomyces nogalater]